MLRVAYHDTQQELLVNRSREDYEEFCETVRQVLASSNESAKAVYSIGPIHVNQIVVRSGFPPNRVSYEPGCVVFSIAPSLQAQFLSFIQFPSDLPQSPIPYHHHFDGVADNGTYVASDSLPVVFGLQDG
jgi:hypothetical protein